MHQRHNNHLSFELFFSRENTFLLSTFICTFIYISFPEYVPRKLHGERDILTRISANTYSFNFQQWYVQNSTPTSCSSSCAWQTLIFTRHGSSNDNYNHLINGSYFMPFVMLGRTLRAEVLQTLRS